MGAIRDVDPDIGRLRGLLGPALRDGKAELAEQIRGELEAAKFKAAIRRAVEAAPPLTPQAQLAVTVLLGGA